MPRVAETALDSHLKVLFLLQNSKSRIFSVGQRYTITGVTPSLTNIDTIANQLAEGFADVFTPVLPATCKYAGVHCWYYGSSSGLLEGFSAGATVSDGDVTSECLPEEDCIIIRKRTGKGGRKYRGRIFMPLVPETLQSEGRLTAGGITAYLALANKFDDVWTFDDVLTGMTATPKHVSWATGEMSTITETGIVVDVTNRRDRRDPKQLIYQRVS